MRGTNQEFVATKRRPGARRPAGSGRARRSARLEVEPLESRVVPTTIVLGPSKDNTLYQSDAGDISNATGNYFFAGRTNMSALRRGVIAFDIAGNVPAGATINSVTLQLHMSKSHFVVETVELRRLLANWGEATSQAFGNEGKGAPATPGDATWIYTFFNTTTWTNPGGDFVSTASASADIGDIGFYTWGSTAQMVADVQSWLQDPASNFGWVVRGNETADDTAKRFDTKENFAPEDRPTLTVDYTASAFVPITISGQVFNDLDGSGTKDPGEPGLPGWTVFLDTNNNGTPDPGEPTTTTDADGNYSFPGLGPGTYYVREVLQDGWQQTTPNPADIVAQSGTDVPGQDFGDFQPQFSPIRTRGHMPPGTSGQLAAVLVPVLPSRPAVPAAAASATAPPPAPVAPADRAAVDRLFASLKARDPQSGLSLSGHSREPLDPGWAGLVLGEDVVLAGAFRAGFREEGPSPG